MTTPSGAFCTTTTSTTRSIRRVTLAGPVLALLLVGCGGSSGTTATGSTGTPSTSATTTAPAAPTTAPQVDVLKGKSAKEVVELASAALQDASGMHVSATLVDAGEKTVIDIASTKAGQAEGTIGLGSVANIKLKVIGSDAYVNGDKGFWTILGGGKSVPADAWLKTTTSDKKFAVFLAFTSAKALAEDLAPGTTLTLAPGKDVNGIPTVGVKGEDGVLYVAAQGAPLPLALSQPNIGDITFSDFDAPLTVTPPPAAKLVS